MTSSNKLTKKQKAELEALAQLPDGQIDTSDIPEAVDWSDAKRGVFYRPVKQQLTLRLDADLVAWFKGHAPGGKGYQTDINRALRAYVEEREEAVNRILNSKQTEQDIKGRIGIGAITVIASFVRNVHFKRAMHEVDEDPHLYFWRVIYGNFHDVAVIEWCKLFGSDHSENQPAHWKSVVPINQQNNFRAGLLNTSSVTQKIWESYWQQMKEHRDNYVAHFNEDYLRPENDPHFPKFDLALKAAHFYYDWILKDMRDRGLRYSYPEDFDDYCRHISKQAIDAATKAINATANMEETVR